MRNMFWYQITSEKVLKQIIVSIFLETKKINVFI